MRLATLSVAGTMAAGYLLAACGSTDKSPNRTEPAETTDSRGEQPSSSTTSTTNMNVSTGSAGSTAVPEISQTLKVSGPVTGGRGEPESIQITDFDAAKYNQKEYFFEGQAAAYAVDGDMTMDGNWKLSEASKAPFRTRLLVRRPIDAKSYNGTVVVEWLNVSGGVDADPGYMYNHPMILREGWAWVGVSAQAVGVDGSQGLSISSLGSLIGGSTPAMMNSADAGPMPAPLKQYDPERYGTLQHPGDDYSFDIFTQAARVVRGEGGMNVLGGLKAERVIAYGESQSAGRMTSYVDGVAPLSKVFDGYFIHSRGTSGTPFTTTGNDLLAGFLGNGTPHQIRGDLGVPVFQFQTETDVFGMLKFLPARQSDTDSLRTWEVAGTSHADKYLTDLSGGAAVPGAFDCPNANDGPQRFVIRAALRALDRWIAEKNPPPHGDLLMLDKNGAPVLDEHGNILGGVRSPDVDVPIETLSGNAAATSQTSSSGGLGSVFCGIFGSTTPFTSDQLMKLYASHDDYVMKVDASGKAAVQKGFLLDQERQEMVDRAAATSVPN